LLAEFTAFENVCIPAQIKKTTKADYERKAKTLLGTSEEIQSLLFKIREDFESTIVLVTHNEELAEACDRSLKLVNGNLDTDV